jgi:2,4-dienoyl-CoA reductase-like NADH-dependent reductase (Old Yellow Enzyme family)
LKEQFGGPYIANEKFTQESAEKALELGWADAISFGVPFIANPDLPRRFAEKAPLNPPDTTTFYTPGAKGYSDYPAL